MADWNASIIAEFRAGGGRVGGMFEGADLVLLTTTGARSGVRRTSPLGVAREDGRLLVFGSNAGGDRHPDWYRNLLVHPRAEVETADGHGGVRTLAVRAEVLEGAERDAAYARQAARIPAYGDYQRGTTRVIPVVALHPLDLTTPDPARDRAIATQLLTVHADLRAQLARLRDGDGAATGEALAVHCLAFCDALGTHHAAEDAVFPAFDEGFPHLAPVLARLRAEHREVAAELTALRKATGEGGADLAGRLDALAARMEEHFAYEEEHLVPVLLGEAAGSEG
ncbi:nitroreductase/quinone reductase family protein [Streptomyces sp. NPDC021020]|uniref:nitroreductase/quinone reductase family protein n=1 Tax=Streptomyces sp. NPDC021020 TaxID=3365109 RepID=UPI0037ADCCA0